MPGNGSTSGKSLKQDKLVAIPLVNKEVGVVFTPIVVVGKGKECVHIMHPISLKRLMFNKVSL